MTTKFKETDTELYKQNKQFGDWAEMACIPFIEEKFNLALNKQGKQLKYICDNTAESVDILKGWDLKFGIYQNDTLLKTITFEIKTDKYNSNNVFFERTCSKKPSGVYVTKADYFIYMLPRHCYDNFFLVRPIDLQNLLEKNKTNYHLTYGGEGNRVSGFLIGKDDFMQDFFEASGKIYTWDITCPDSFNLPKLKCDTEVRYIFKEVNNVLSYKEVRMKL